MMEDYFMSVRLGIILSKDLAEHTLSDIRNKYHFGLIPIVNASVCAQLPSNENFFQVSSSGCDDLTGIGAYKLLHKDLSPLKSAINDPILLESVLHEYNTRTEGYQNDVCKWIQIINDLKMNYKIGSVALFWHFCSTSFDKERIVFKKIMYCRSLSINSDTLMQLPEDELLYFN
jgi:hypothetical protein